MKKTLIFSLLAMLFLIYCPGANAANFKEAVASYRAKDYKNALTQLQACDKKFPGNTLIKYYMALTHQQLGQIPKAKANYLWVAKNGNMNYRERAQKGYDQLSGLSSSRSTSSSANTTSGGGLKTGPAQKKKEIASKCLYFWATW